jgi:prophage antirepressor-like protein
MENAMTKLAVFAFGNQEIRTATDEHGEIWFVAADVCAALELANPRDALAAHVDPEDVGRRDTLTPGGMQAVNHVNESGLYALIFGSRKEAAKQFKRWVTSEVLPAIRKTGQYVADSSVLQYLNTMNTLADNECVVITKGGMSRYTANLLGFNHGDGIPENAAPRPGQGRTTLVTSLDTLLKEFKSELDEAQFIQRMIDEGIVGEHSTLELPTKSIRKQYVLLDSYFGENVDQGGELVIAWYYDRFDHAVNLAKHAR